MINAQINTTSADQFGASAEPHPLRNGTVRLTVTANNGQILVWDMTEQQMMLIYNRMKPALGFIHQ